MIIVDQPGPLALLQDQGRPGLAKLGVSPSGAADRSAYALANRLVGNDEDCAAIETTLGGLTVTATRTHWVSVTGAPTRVVVDHRPVGSHRPIALRPGETLRIEVPVRGLRNYLAVRGGLLADSVLESRSTDVLSGLGPKPLTGGQQLEVGLPTRPWPGVDVVPVPGSPSALTILPGPRDDWFSAPTWSEFLAVEWSVTQDCDRVAARLRGPLLHPVHDHELPSEGLVRGAVQVPPSGQPLIFLADHPVTGGYPVLGVLTERAADHAAQLRPGDSVRFTTSPLGSSPREEQQ